MPWYESLTAFNFPHVFSLALTKENLKAELQRYTSDYALVEFYMPWCPHCQHFAPEMERIGLAISQYGQTGQRNTTFSATAAFQAPPFKKDPLLVTGTVDCMRSAALCNALGGGSGFPRLMWGLREDWVAGRMGKIQEINLEDGTAEALAKVVNLRLKAHLDPSTTSREQIMPLMYLKDGKPMKPATGLVLSPKKADTWDMQLAVALFIRGAMSPRNTFAPAGRQPPWLRFDGGNKQALVNFVGVLAKRFPEDSAAKGAPCKTSLQALHQRMVTDFNSLGGWDRDGVGTRIFRLDPDKLEKEWQLCGTDWSEYSKGWRSCRGTWPGKRGFTCGLWNTFHSVAARSDDKSSAQDTEALRQAVLKFFDCDDCRNHFSTIAVRPKDTKTRAAAQLWWWQAHNNVNLRVSGIEQRYQDGDPSFLKVQWPTQAQCPGCWLNASSGSLLSVSRRGVGSRAGLAAAAAPASGEAWTWKASEVTGFLERFYG